MTTGPTIWARAKAELERRGWHQGDFIADSTRPEHSAVCLNGALHAACHGDPRPADSFGHPVCPAWGAISIAADHLSCGPAEWNDNLDRTLDEVYALFDEMDEREAASR